MCESGSSATVVAISYSQGRAPNVWVGNSHHILLQKRDNVSIRRNIRQSSGLRLKISQVSGFLAMKVKSSIFTN